MTGTHPQGIVVIDADGGLSWWSPRPPAVATTAVSVGDGVVVEVDAASPGDVVAWAVDPGGDVAALTAALEDAPPADVLRDLVAGGEFAAKTGSFRLTPTWTRVATVTAVSRWSIRVLREGALALDEAAARQRAGDEAGAARLFRRSMPTLTSLAEDCEFGLLEGGAVTEFRDVVDSAALALPGHAAVLAAAESLAAVDADIDSGWTTALTAWSSEKSLQDALPALTHSRSDTITSIVDGQVDPRLIPPRTLAWPGAAGFDILATFDPVTDTARIIAALDDSADPGSAEALGLLAYLVESGRVVAVAPLRVDGRYVTGELPCRGVDRSELSFGIIAADVDLAQIRIGATEQELVTADRWALQAWNQAREATISVFAADDIDAADDTRPTRLAKARDAVDEAIRSLARYRREAATDEPGIASRIAQLERFQSTIGAAADYAQRPLLAELTAETNV